MTVGEHKLSAKHIMIATGGHPVFPNVSGELLMTATMFSYSPRSFYMKE